MWSTDNTWHTKKIGTSNDIIYIFFKTSNFMCGRNTYIFFTSQRLINTAQKAIVEIQLNFQNKFHSWKKKILHVLGTRILCIRPGILVPIKPILPTAKIKKSIVRVYTLHPRVIRKFPSQSKIIYIFYETLKIWFFTLKM